MVSHNITGVIKYTNEKDKSLLEQSILNNIFKGTVDDARKIDKFVNYMINNIKLFENNSESMNLEKNFTFIDFK